LSRRSGFVFFGQLPVTMLRPGDRAPNQSFACRSAGLPRPSTARERPLAPSGARNR